MVGPNRKFKYPENNLNDLFSAEFAIFPCKEGILRSILFCSGSFHLNDPVIQTFPESSKISSVVAFLIAVFSKFEPDSSLIASSKPVNFPVSD